MANSYYFGFIRHFVTGVEKDVCEKELEWAAGLIANVRFYSC